MTKTHKRILLLACAIVLPVLASACHTIEGAGKDVTAVGKGMESAASQ